MMILRRLQPSETREAHEYIKAHHQKRSAPPGHIAAFEFLESAKRVGVALVGRPTARTYDPDLIVEFTRLCFADKGNCGSQALSMMRAWVRKWLPGIRLVISYSDPGDGHEGTIYRADNWCPLRKTRAMHEGSGWDSRKERTLGPYSAKVLWVRSP